MLLRRQPLPGEAAATPHLHAHRCSPPHPPLLWRRAATRTRRTQTSSSTFRDTHTHPPSPLAAARVLREAHNAQQPWQHQQEQVRHQQQRQSGRDRRPSQQQPPPLVGATGRVLALARRHGLPVATAHLLLSNTVSLGILVLGVLSSTRLGPAAAPAAAALLLANQASRPVRFAAAVALAPAADAALDALARLLAPLLPPPRSAPRRARLAAAAALLCAQAALMLLALGVAVMYAATAGRAA